MTTESIDDRQDARNEEVPQNAHQPEDAKNEEIPQSSPEDTESDDTESPNAEAARYREKLREAEATVTTLTGEQFDVRRHAGEGGSNPWLQLDREPDPVTGRALSVVLHRLSHNGFERRYETFHSETNF